MINLVGLCLSLPSFSLFVQKLPIEGFHLLWYDLFFYLVRAFWLFAVMSFGIVVLFVCLLDVAREFHDKRRSWRRRLRQNRPIQEHISSSMFDYL